MFALVTGGSGFLGRYLVEQLLARGDRVRSFSRRPSAVLDAVGVETVCGDVRDRQATESACQRVDTVFHTAGVAGIWGPWERYHGINTIGTINLVDSALQTGVGSFVYTSSPSVTFDGTDQNQIDESAPYPSRWLCHYAHSKALAEKYVLDANGRGGLLTCALRPHLIWGPRDQHLIPRLLERARSGRLRRVGTGGNLIDTIYVENAATAHLQAADALEPNSPVSGQAYFLSQGKPVLCWPWIDEILALAGLPPVRKSISARTAWTVGLGMEIAYSLLRLNHEPPMTRFLAAQLSTSHFFDLSRAREHFGYFSEISTAEGMRRLGEELQT